MITTEISWKSIKETVQQVTDLSNQLATEKADLEVMQNDHRNRKQHSKRHWKRRKQLHQITQLRLLSQNSRRHSTKPLIEQQTAELAQIEEAKRRAAEEGSQKGSS